MKRFLKWFLRSGIWTQPILWFLLTHFIENWREYFLALLVCSFLPVLLLLMLKFQTNPKKDTERPSATHPKLPKELLRDTPQDWDVVLGKYASRYVCWNIESDGNLFICGGSGSGKSSCLILPILLQNPNIPALVLDIKGELRAKATRAGDERIRIFNPADKTAWGYDPLYTLGENSSEQDQFLAMQSIAFSLIPTSANQKDAFWSNSARNLLIGLLLFFYGEGSHDFISIVDDIFSSPIAQTIEAAMQTLSPDTIAYKYIVQCSGMADETLSGIFAEISNSLTIFVTDADLRRAIGGGGRKVNPRMLEEGYSIYLSIQEHKLAAYYNLLQLIINQTLGELEQRPENAKPILIVIDELARIVSAGKINKLIESAKTLRSRHVRLVIVSQSLEALMIAYSEHEVTDLISNFPYKAILDASSSRTQKMVCDWAGKYKERRVSVSNGKNKSLTTTYDDKDILYPSDLMTLVRTGELILISPYGYHRLQKCPYYSDPYFQPLAEEIKIYNETTDALHSHSHKEDEFNG
ncbi:MAG: type IV secretory system conjugative DNA transfer family protein [Oscillospiraceae bacterium]|nr:type IV secretory system conjugative DNA transfer family protein [Oscillospiraceae bacterium]